MPVHSDRALIAETFPFAEVGAEEKPFEMMYKSLVSCLLLDGMFFPSSSPHRIRVVVLHAATEGRLRITVAKFEQQAALPQLSNSPR